MVRSHGSLRAEYQAKTPTSSALWEKGKDSMPAGIIKGAYDDPRPLGGWPLFIERANGCFLTDVDGNNYVDFANHHTTTLLGHTPPGVMGALREQLESGLGFGHASKLESEITALICSRMAAVEQVRFTNSGTEASLHVCRMVRAITGKQKIAKFEGQYHGSHDSVEWSVGPKTAGTHSDPEPVPVVQGMPDAMADLVVILPWQMDEAARIVRADPDIAAVFYEGNLASSMDLEEGVAAHAQAVRELTESVGALMVMDEVVCFRTSYSGFQGYVGVKPDLTIFGKAVGGGLPVGAIGGKKVYMDALDGSNPDTFLLNQSGTFSGNTLTLAAGLATLQAMTPELFAHLDTLGARLQEGLQTTLAKAGKPARVNRCASMVNVWPGSTAPITDMRASDPSSRGGGKYSSWWELVSFGLTVKGYRISSGWMQMSLSEPMNEAIVDGLVHAVEEILVENDPIVTPTTTTTRAGVPQQIAAATTARAVAGRGAARL